MATHFGCVIGRYIVGWSVVNDVLLPNVISPISQASVRLVSRVGVEVVDLIVDPRRDRVVERLVVDFVLVIATGIRATRCADEPVVLVLTLIDTDHRCVIWFTSPLLSLRTD